MDERIEDLLPIYALGGLTDEENRKVEAYLDTHPGAEDELNNYLQVTEALAYVGDPLLPLESTEINLMARVEADAQKRSAQVAHVVVEKRIEQKRPLSTSSQPSIWASLKNFLSSPVLSGAALALAAMTIVFATTLLGRNDALLSSNAALDTQNSTLSNQVAALTTEIDGLQQENQSLVDENLALIVRVTSLVQDNSDLSRQLTTSAQNASNLEAEIAELVATNTQLNNDYAELDASTQTARNIMNILTSPSVHTVEIPGNPETQPDASGQFVVDASSNTAILIVTGMGVLPDNSVYQVLLIQGSEHETAETFVVDTQGESVLIVSSEQPLGNFDAVGVSIEPEGGSEQRTGEVVLIGSLIN